jgi:hypothetical protein
MAVAPQPVSLPIAAPVVAPLAIATLSDDLRHNQLICDVGALLLEVGIELQLECIPSDLATVGAVGRIGVPRDAELIVRRQRVAFGVGFREAPLEPVARLWRGLQRRADVLVDQRCCTTLPGSGAASAGNIRDVLLMAQRVLERGPMRTPSDLQRADHWARARESAELVYRVATAEQRTVLLVAPIGRGTGAQQSFADALDRHARAQRLPAPRVVKAGLLAALLSGASGDTRWLAASVMPIDELSAMVAEAIGDTGAWPVVSVGRSATFYDLPASSACAQDPVPVILSVVDQLHRRGQATLGRALMDALLITSAAVCRMREELGGTLTIPVAAFLDGMRANWGRTPTDVPNESRAGQSLAATSRKSRRASMATPHASYTADRVASPSQDRAISV